MKPDMFKKLPPKISRCDPFSFTLYFCNDRKNLFFVNRSFHIYLCISDNKQFSLLVDVMNPMHHIRLISSLKKHHIPSFQFFFWLLHQNIVSLMDQKRIHTAPTDHHADFFSLFYQIFQYRDINVICNLSHSSNTSPCS